MAEPAPATGTPEAAPAQPAAPAGAPSAEAAPAGTLIGAATEATTAETAATEPGQEGDAPEAPEGAPEAYADFTLPEGVTLDPQLFEKAAPLLKAANLPQAKAQEFVDLAVEIAQATRQREFDSHVARLEGWKSEIVNDPEIGGQKLKASQGLWSKAIDTLAGGDVEEAAAIRQALNETGAGNRVALARAFTRLGKLVSEDRIRRGDPVQSEAPKDAASKIYPNMPRQRK